MSTVLLIRHGETDAVGKRLTSRMAGVHLNAHGQQQAQRLADALADFEPYAVYSSPLERAQQTAAPVCERLQLTCETAAEFTEFDFGEWTNRDIADLADDRLWQRFNSERGAVTAPNGESMLQVQRRAVGKLNELVSRHSVFAVVSHCDVIRAVLLHALGMSLDLFLRIDVDPASVSIIEVGDVAPRVRLLNWRPAERLPL